jgi:hypothetical protein
MFKLFAFAAAGLMGLALAGPARAGDHGCRDRGYSAYHRGHFVRDCRPVRVYRECYTPVYRPCDTPVYRVRVRDYHDRDCYRPPVCRPHRRYCD